MWLGRKSLIEKGLGVRWGRGLGSRWYGCIGWRLMRFGLGGREKWREGGWVRVRWKGREVNRKWGGQKRKRCWQTFGRMLSA